MGLRVDQGYMSMRAVMRRTNYGLISICNAAKRAGIKLKRDKAAYRITEEQYDAIVGELSGCASKCFAVKGGFWDEGKKPKVCLKCGRDNRPHKARGLCINCYAAQLRAKQARDRLRTTEQALSSVVELPSRWDEMSKDCYSREFKIASRELREALQREERINED
jgi:hypothetical protein